MGIAAYNRGSKAISDRISQEQNRPSIFHYLTQHSTQHATRSMFSVGTVVRYDATGFYLMNRQGDGWGEYALGPYKTLWAVATEFRLFFVGLGSDKHSKFIRVEAI